MRPLRHSCTPSVIPAPAPSFLRPLRHSCTPLRHSCARSVIPAPPSVIPERPLRHSCTSLRHSCTSLRHSCALSVIPAPPPPSFLRPLRHSCAGRNPGEPAGFENGADAGRPPAGPSAPSGGSVARRRDGGIGGPAAGASEQARCSPCPSRRDRFDTLRSRAHAPPPSFLRPLRHSCAGRNPGEPAGFENGADAGRPPVGPSARSGGLVARPRDGGVGRTWVVAWIPACAGMTDEGGRDDGVMDGDAAVDRVAAATQCGRWAIP